jgi:hypothetical protein
MESNDIYVMLKAKNSSGEQKLWLTSQRTDNEMEYFFTLTGILEGSRVQIDFDEMTKTELEDIKTMIELILDAHN